MGRFQGKWHSHLWMCYNISPFFKDLFILGEREREREIGQHGGRGWEMLDQTFSEEGFFASVASQAKMPNNNGMIK